MKREYASITLILILLIISSCAKNNPPPVTPPVMTKELCDSARGHWNECSSPCLGTDAEYCIEVCAEQCECGGIAGFGCPDGYKCRLTGKIADEMGACIPDN